MVAASIAWRCASSSASSHARCLSSPSRAPPPLPLCAREALSDPLAGAELFAVGRPHARLRFTQLCPRRLQPLLRLGENFLLHRQRLQRSGMLLARRVQAQLMAHAGSGSVFGAGAA